MCQTFIPLLAPKGRIVNLSSVASALKLYNEQVQQRFRNPKLSLDDLEDLAQEFQVCLDSEFPCTLSIPQFSPPWSRES